MTSPVHTVRQNASVEIAVELMTAKSVTALPVVDLDGGLVGMVSEGDLLWHRVPAEPTTDVSAVPGTDPAHRPRHGQRGHVGISAGHHPGCRCR